MEFNATCIKISGVKRSCIAFSTFLLSFAEIRVGFSIYLYPNILNAHIKCSGSEAE
jgi:hypothetical protein